MFGDLFNTRGDYSSGLYYGGSRKYLNDTDSIEPPDIFKTKQQMKHKVMRAKQEKAGQSTAVVSSPIHSKNSKDKAVNVITEDNLKNLAANLNAMVLTDDVLQKRANIERKKKREMRRRDREAKKATCSFIVLEDKFHKALRNYTAEDWVEKTEAGCNIWVNRRTREVLDRPPMEMLSKFENTKVSSNQCQEKEMYGEEKDKYDLVETKKEIILSSLEESEKGVGYPIYDGTDLNELLKELDKIK